MIGTSLDPQAFSEVPTEERLRVDPSPYSPMVISDAIEITRSPEGTEVTPASDVITTDIPPVERTLDQIIEKCEREVRAHPKSHRPIVNLAIALLNRGRRDEGIAKLEEALAYKEDDYVALALLAAAYFHAGSLEKSRTIYLRILEIFPSSSAAYQGLASISLRQGDFLSAATDLAKALEADPNQVAARCLLAMVNFKLGKPNQAIALLRKGLRDNVTSSELNQTLAVAFLLAGDLRRSERAFHTTLSLRPHMPSAVHGLVVVLFQQRRIEDAISVLARQVAFSPNDRQSREMMAHAFVMSKRYNAARPQLTHLLEALEKTTPQNTREKSRINNNIGFCFAMEGKRREAEKSLVASIEIDPKFGVQPYENLARLYFSEKRYGEALERVDAALALDLDTPDLHLLREVCLVNLGYYQEAVTELEQLLRSGNAPAAAYADLGWLLSEWFEDYDSAIAVLKQGFEKWSDNQLIINNLAYVHLMRGETASARYLLALIPESNNQPTIVATRGLLLIMEGNIEAGEGLYKKAEVIAAQLGDRDLMFAIRQKKYLEAARAYLQIGALTVGKDYLTKGLSINSVSRIYPFVKQLSQLSQHLLK